MPKLDTLRQHVSSSLVVAARHWRRTVHGVIAAYNVSEACAAPLLIAGRLNAPVRQVALAEMTGIEGPSLVRLLDQLCKADLVRRDEDPEDGRAKMISLTDEGRAVTAKIETQLMGFRAGVLAEITSEDLEATIRVLNAFNAAAKTSNQASNQASSQASKRASNQANRATRHARLPSRNRGA